MDLTNERMKETIEKNTKKGVVRNSAEEMETQG
jgi:hypothetical protein